jgi:rare lipoprotein A
MDLSRRSAEVLGFQSDGTALVRVKYLGRAPLNGDDRYEQKFLASQGWMRVAAKGRSGKGKPQAAEVASLPPENPENLQTPWKDAAPVQSAAATPAPAQPNAAASYGWTMVSPPKEAEAAPLDAPLYWQASPRVAERPQVAATGSLPQAGKQSGRTGGFLIQAGSFKSRENADKARAVLAPVAPVELAEIETGGNVYFRVRVGPFPDDTAAEAALVKVTQAGYQGAKIIAKN